MKIRSTKELPYDADRLGIKKGIIEIDLRIVNKDDVAKTYTLKATDYVIMPESEFVGNPYPGMLNNSGRRQIAEKLYVKSYAEYDAQRDFLLNLDTSGLIGSELEDKLLQDALLYSATKDTIYTSTAADWDIYNDPIIVAKVPVLDETDGKLISGEADPYSNITFTFVKEAVTATALVVAGPSGQFAYIPYPVLPIGTKVTAVATTMLGLVSAVSNEVIATAPVEPVV